MSGQTKGQVFRGIVFFIFFYIYFWRYIQLQFMPHAVVGSMPFPVFFKGWAFFHSFITSPGGLSKYTASFFAQMFYFSSAGAAVITLIALLFYILTDYIVKSFNASVLRPLRFVPAILLLTIYSQYRNHIEMTVALMFALLFVCMHIRLTKQSRLFYIMILIESVMLYYLAGGAFLVFIFLCTFYEMFITRSLFKTVICLLTALIVPYIIGAVICEIPPDHAFTLLTPFYWETFIYDKNRAVGAAYSLYLFMPVTVLLALIGKLWNNTFGLKTEGDKQSSIKRPFWRKMPSQAKWSLETLPLIVITVAVIFYFTDKELKTLCELDYYLYRQMWPQLIERAKDHRKSFTTICYADIAMSKTGRLGYDLLKWHKGEGTLKALFLNAPGYKNAHWSKANINLNIGWINPAQHYLVVSMESCGRLPIILQRLALMHMITGDNDTAKVYLNSLKKTLFHKDIAEYYLSAIKKDPSLSGIEQIQHYRKMIVEDEILIHSGEARVKALIDQVELNHNRAALEYLFSNFLITRRLGPIANNISWLKKLGYERIPRLYEEAIAVYQFTAKKRVDLQGYRISPETIANCRKFDEMMLQLSSNQQGSIAEFERFFGDSYLLYHYKKIRK